MMISKRRLAAIVAADVAGYSLLMGADEQGTLDRLRTVRTEIVDPAIAQHRGRIVKTTGDGLLVEFTSVVDALQCATEIQAVMAERNTDIDAEKRIAPTHSGRECKRGRFSGRIVEQFLDADIDRHTPLRFPSVQDGQGNNDRSRP